MVVGMELYSQTREAYEADDTSFFVYSLCGLLIIVLVKPYYSQITFYIAMLRVHILLISAISCETTRTLIPKLLLKSQIRAPTLACTDTSNALVI